MATEEMVTKIACGIIELNRIRTAGATPHWDDLPAEQAAEMLAFVRGTLLGRSPEQQHEAWVVDQMRAGWVLGDVYDAQAKTDPRLVHWEEYDPVRRTDLQRAAHLARVLEMQAL